MPPPYGVIPRQLKVLHRSSFQIMLFFAQQKEGTPTIYLSSFFVYQAVSLVSERREKNGDWLLDSFGGFS
jgi:hypothetical protein